MSKFRSFSLFALALALAGSNYLFAQSQPAPLHVQATCAQSWQLVLQEIQQTRLIVKQAVQHIYRAQMLLAEMRLRHEQSQRCQTEINQLRQTSLESQSDMLRQQERLREVLSLLATEQDNHKLETLRAEENEIHLVIQEQTQQESLRQEREAQLKLEWNTEQSRLAELNRQLIELEKELNPTTGR